MRFRHGTTMMAILAVIVIFSLPVLAQQDNKVFVPFVATGGGAEAASKQADLERPPHIPADWVLHGYGPDGAPVWGPDTSNAPVSFEGSAGPTEMKPGEITYASGKETAGQEIGLRDRVTVKLPLDVYVKYYLDVDCILGEELPDGTWKPWPPCPEGSLMILAREGTEDTIILLGDGSFMVQTENPATLARVADRFADVIVQTGKAPTMDPRLPFIPQERKINALP